MASHMVWYAYPCAGGSIGMSGLLSGVRGIAALVCCALAAHGIARGQGSDKTYVPSATSVAILPVANTTGARTDGHQANLAKAAMSALLKQTAGRGFKTITGKPIEEALSRLHVDLTDIEQQKRAVMMQVGQEVGADLVAFVVIMDVNTDSDSNGWVSATRAAVKTKSWLLDVKSGRPIMSAKVETADSTDLALGANRQTTKAEKNCSTAVIRVFERVLKQYPIVRPDADK